MKHAELGKNFKVFLSSSEMDRYQKILYARGAKMAPFARQVLLREIESIEAVESGKTQIDIKIFPSTLEDTQKVTE